jgi:phage gp37-like protein
LVCRQYVHPDPRIWVMWGTKNPAASHGHKFLR